MEQRTLVLTVPREHHAALRARLGGGAFEWRTVPHALFSVKGEGAVLTLYASGKLVVQGDDPEGFLVRHTDLVPPPGPARETPAGEPLADLDQPLVGSDETGKGDFFGPLVVVAARVEPELASRLRAAGVADSKKLSDARALLLAAHLRELVPHAVRRLDPPDYNRAHAEHGNLNPLLASLHAAAIGEVARPGDRVLVDQFADERVMQRALAGRDLRLLQSHRAERNVAVATASVLARAEFLLALRELSERFGVELAKGAGAPTDEAGRRFVRLHGLAALGEVAKTHFKNASRIRPAGGAR